MYIKIKLWGLFPYFQAQKLFYDAERVDFHSKDVLGRMNVIKELTNVIKNLYISPLKCYLALSWWLIIIISFSGFHCILLREEQRTLFQQGCQMVGKSYFLAVCGMVNVKEARDKWLSAEQCGVIHMLLTSIGVYTFLLSFFSF